MRVIKVGRNPVNDVVVSDPGVSSQHAVITVSSSGIVCLKILILKMELLLTACVYKIRCNCQMVTK